MGLFGSVNEEFIEKVKGIMQELKLPLIDDHVYDEADITRKDYNTKVVFVQEEDSGESIIRGFLGIAEYYKTIIIQVDDEFYIPADDVLFLLQPA